MKPSAQAMLRTFVVLVLALAALATQPLVAADSTVEGTGGIEPAFVGIWTAPGTTVLVVVIPLPTEAPEPTEDEADKNSVILEDGAPF